jgi:hypothetical protein
MMAFVTKALPWQATTTKLVEKEKRRRQYNTTMSDQEEDDDAFYFVLLAILSPLFIFALGLHFSWPCGRRSGNDTRIKWRGAFVQECVSSETMGKQGRVKSSMPSSITM